MHKSTWRSFRALWIMPWILLTCSACESVSYSAVQAIPDGRQYKLILRKTTTRTVPTSIDLLPDTEFFVAIGTDDGDSIHIDGKSVQSIRVGRPAVSPVLFPVAGTTAWAQVVSRFSLPHMDGFYRISEGPAGVKFIDYAKVSSLAARFALSKSGRWLLTDGEKGILLTDMISGTSTVPKDLVFLEKAHCDKESLDRPWLISDDCRYLILPAKLFNARSISDPPEMLRNIQAALDGKDSSDVLLDRQTGKIATLAVDESAHYPIDAPIALTTDNANVLFLVYRTVKGKEMVLAMTTGQVLGRVEGVPHGNVTAFNAAGEVCIFCPGGGLNNIARVYLGNWKSGAIRELKLPSTEVARAIEKK